MAGILCLAVIAASTATALHRPPLRDQSMAAAHMAPATDVVSMVVERAELKPGSTIFQTGASGADVETIRNGDGSIVTKVTPLDRPQDGPVILTGARAIGQSAHMAHLPIPELLEPGKYGDLPVIGPDGKKPVEAYARPWSGARGTRIAIVVGGLGVSQTGTQYAIQTLPEGVTLAFAASGNSLQRWLQEARRGNHEVLLQIPFEPFGYPSTDPGPHTLVTADGTRQNIDDLHWALGRITNYTGVMNFMGSRFLSDPDAIEPVLQEIAGRGILFLDDGTSAQSLAGVVSQSLGVPFAQADMVVDQKLSTDVIMARLDEVERIARRNGEAIAVASAFEVSVDTVAAWIREVERRGVEIVPVSALVEH
ncbi:divergent polysaccharide deacetylase family protein [Flavimaribacter sediminis]|uniref:divergent polysaccharide deacetylase family protein n=1 Tax=Flavimaribacter sediminis TaxID=2865987 RepID=UPI00278C8B88|nr:divergent polysaccharide deacetylase family protein [Flavimaribacter sediminis]